MVETHTASFSPTLSIRSCSAVSNAMYFSHFCIHLHFEIYIFLALNMQLMGPGVNHRFVFFVAYPLSRLSRCASCKRSWEVTKRLCCFWHRSGVFQQALPPEVALLVFSDQSNALIGSRLVPHTPLSSPDFIYH